MYNKSDLSSTSKIAVLYVDDEKMLLDLTKTYLEEISNYNLQVDVLTDPSQVFDRMKQKNYDIIVSDYQMPELDGLQLLELLRKQNKTIPFIIFTGRGREQVAMKALNLGASFYIMKGVDIQSQYGELFHAIKSAVHHSRTEKALREREAMLREVIDLVPHEIFARDEDGRHILINKAAASNYDLPPEKVVGKTFLDLGFDSEYFRKCLEEDRIVLKSGKTLFVPEETVIKGQKANEIHQTVKIPFSSAGVPAILGISIDISDLKAREEALRESEEQLRLIIDLLPHYIYVRDIDGRYLLANKATAEAFKRTPAEVEGKSPIELSDSVNGANRPNFIEDFQKIYLKEDRDVIKSGKPLLIQEQALITSGKRTHFQTIKIPFNYKGISAVLGVSIDITKYKLNDKE
ncbi:MAG: response regulator [Candidatus Odinarchaeota archaeon]